MQNRLSPMRGKRCFKSLLDSSRHGFVFTSISLVFMCSSRMKSYPRSSNVYLYERNLPLTDLMLSCISLIMVVLNCVCSSSCVFPSICGTTGSSTMWSNNYCNEMMLPSSNLPYSSPVFWIALLVNWAKSCSSSGALTSNSLYYIELVLTYGSLNKSTLPSAEL